MFWFFPDFAVLFVQLFLLFSLFIISRAHFSMPNSIPIFWLYILIVCIRVFSFLLFLKKYLGIVNVNWSFIFSCDYYYYTCEFFTPALAGGLSLESEWQQVSSCLQEFFNILSQQFCCLDRLDSASGFRLFQCLFQAFADCSKCINYNSYHRHLHIPIFSSSPAKQCLVLYFFCINLLLLPTIWLIVSSLSLSASPIFAILLCVVDLNIIGPYSVVLCCC